MIITPKPLKKELFDRAKSLGVKVIVLNFSGGSDEGYLNVYTDPYNNSAEHIELRSDLEEWGHEVYEYSGGGDGSDYGDDIEYNLSNMRVIASSWQMVREESGDKGFDLMVEDDVKLPENAHDDFKD